MGRLLPLTHKVYLLTQDMRQEVSIGRNIVVENRVTRHTEAQRDDIVLDKSIFSNIFDKDIRRVFIYKKAERLANALGLITPAFHDSLSLRGRIESIALALTEAATRSPATFRDALSRELLSLSSVLSLARVGGLLSPMNAELIGAEARSLLREVTSYEEPQITLAGSPTLAAIARQMPPSSAVDMPSHPAGARVAPTPIKDTPKGSKGRTSMRRENIVSLIGQKGTVTIRDLSTMIRGVSEKTIQRELLVLIGGGQIVKRGERRWSTYSLSPHVQGGKL